MSTDAPHSFERQLRTRLRDRWNCDAPAGCLTSEIESLQEINGCELPAVYRQFLSVCGHRAGDLFRDYNWSLSTRGCRNAELRLVCDEFDLVPAGPTFSFLDYLGDYFWCFELSGDPNPIVIRHDTGWQWLPLPTRLDTFLLTWEQHE